MRRQKLLVLLSVIAVLGTACTSTTDQRASTPLESSTGGQSSPIASSSGRDEVGNVVGGGYALDVPDGALEPGSDVTITPDAAVPAPPSALGIGAPPPVSIVTATQPTSPVALTTTYDPAMLPAGTHPLLAYYAEALDLWVPVDTTADAATKQLTAQVSHFSDWAAVASGVGETYNGLQTTVTSAVTQGAAAIDRAIVAGVTSATTSVGNGLGLLSYQINKWAFDARADRPSCGKLPGWVEAVLTTDAEKADPNAFLYACGEEGEDNSLRLVVVNNRPYAAELALPEQPSQVSLTTSKSAPFAGVADIALANQWRAMSEGWRLYLPPLSTTAIDLPQPPADTAVDSWQLYGTYNPALVMASLLLNKALNYTLSQAMQSLPGGDTVMGQIAACVAVAVGQPAVLDIVRNQPGPTLVDTSAAVRDCTATGAQSAADTITQAAEVEFAQNGIISKSHAEIALGARATSDVLRQLSAAQTVYDLGGLTFEAMLAEADQLAVIGVTFQPLSPARGSHTAWKDDQLTITDHSLGAVQVGMSLDEAQAAAGIAFDASDDGAHYPTTLPDHYPELFVRGVDHVSCVGASTGGSRLAELQQRVITPEDVGLGDSVAQLVAAYGGAAAHVPSPADGRSPADGYVVTSDNGRLAFRIDPQTSLISGIYGGPDVTPSNCSG